MFKVILTFLKVNNKRLILLALFSLLVYGSFFIISYIVNPEHTVKAFTSAMGFPLNILSFVLESVITHYVLIFVVILPAMRKERSNRKILTILILVFLIKFMFNYTSFIIEQSYDMKHNSIKPVLSETSFSWLMIISYVLSLLASFSAALFVEWMHKGKERIILEKQKTEAELSALKHQINPHFLFNSLSFIYGKVMKLDKETADSVLMLANIMRYALGKSTNNDGKVNILDELEHMKNVVEINQRRHNRQLNIQYDEQIDDQSISIIPLVLITLVENAFKHGDLLDPDHPLLISISTSVNELTFTIKNKKGKGIKELSNGVGLPNIKQQLNLTYRENCIFSIDDDELYFSVLLKIKFSV